MRWLNILIILVLAQSALAVYTMYEEQENAQIKELDTDIASSHIKQLANHLNLDKEVIEAQIQNHAATITKKQIKGQITQVQIKINPLVTLQNAKIYEITNADEFTFYDPVATQTNNIIEWDYQTIRRERTLNYAYATDQNVKSSTIIIAAPTQLQSLAKPIIPIIIFTAIAVFVLGGGVTSFFIVRTNATPKEVEKYIKTQRSQGKSDVFIHYQMHKAGWSDEDALKYINKVK